MKCNIRGEHILRNFNFGSNQSSGYSCFIKCDMPYLCVCVCVCKMPLWKSWLGYVMQGAHSWFQTCAVFWLLYPFFWVIPRSEFYVPTFRNTLFHHRGWCKVVRVCSSRTLTPSNKTNFAPSCFIQDDGGKILVWKFCVYVLEYTSLHPRILVKFRDCVSAANIKATMVWKVASRILVDVFRFAYLHISARFLGWSWTLLQIVCTGRQKLKAVMCPVGEDISRHSTVFFLW
jgi:hypothetical protein